LHVGGPTTHDGEILENLRIEARKGLAPMIYKRNHMFDLDPFETNLYEEETDALVQSR
jgi:hypothetical protein